MKKETYLHQIVGGASLLFLGVIITYFIKFLIRIILSRYLGPSEYGLLALGDAVVNIGLTISLFGLTAGATKYIPHYLEKKKLGKVKGIIISIIKITTITSVLLTIMIIFLSDYISLMIFKNVQFKNILPIFALVIPFFTLANVFSNIFLAFKKVKYQNILWVFGRSFTYFIFIIIIVLFNKNLKMVVYSYLLSQIIPFLMGIYLLEWKTFSIFRSKIVAIYEYRRLLKFSLPLFISNFFIQLMGWIDSIFLGVLKTSYDVGIYNAILPLVGTITIFLSVLGNMFLPISSELHTKNEFNKITNTYISISRWLFILSAPISMFFFIFPKEIITVVFGASYVQGYMILRILIASYFIKVILGPSSQTLITFNKTKILLYINLISMMINLLMNYILIQKYGILGAAIATSISILLREIILFMIVKRKLDLHFKFDLYYKYLISIALPLILIKIIIQNIEAITWFILMICFISYHIIYLLMLYFLNSFSKSDLIIIELIENKKGISLNRIKKYLKR
ncbi:MAG: flippase [Lutibacter sp.]|nr:flippase [Lutibacter sp.]